MSIHQFDMDWCVFLPSPRNGEGELLIRLYEGIEITFLSQYDLNPIMPCSRILPDAGV